MDKNLPDIDSLFKKAHEAQDYEPTDAIWQQLEARLDKRDAEKYKRAFILWRIAGVFLLIICGVLATYTIGFWGTSRNSKTTSSSTQPVAVSAFDQKQKAAENNKTVPDQSGDKYPLIGDKESAGKMVTNEAKLPNKEIDIALPHSIQKNSYPTPGEKNLAVGSEIKRKTVAASSQSPGQKRGNHPGLRESIKQQYAPSTRQLVSIYHEQAEKQAPTAEMQTVEQKQRSFTLNTEKLLHTVGQDKTHPATSNKMVRLSPKTRPAWTITAFACNDWSGYRLDDDDHHNRGNGRDHKADIEERENHEAAFTLGLTLTRQIQKWRLMSGLQYAQTKIGIAPRDIYASQSNGSIGYKYVTSSGYVNIGPDFNGVPVSGDSIQSAAATHSLRIVTLPLMAGYNIHIHKKFSITPAVGIAANYIAKAKIKTTLDMGGNTDELSVNRLDGMHKYYLDFLARADMQYQVAKNWSINLIPSMRYAVTPVTKDNVVKTYPYNFGIGAGITYMF